MTGAKSLHADLRPRIRTTQNVSHTLLTKEGNDVTGSNRQNYSACVPWHGNSRDSSIADCAGRKRGSRRRSG